MHRFLFGFFALFAIAGAQAAQVVTVLRVPTHESPPKYFRDRGTVRGLCIDVLRAIERVEPSVRFAGWDEQIPIRRIEAMVRNGGADAMLCMARTPEREATMVAIDSPIFSVDTHLIVRVDEPSAINSLDDLRKLGDEGLVLVWGGTAQATWLAAQPGIRFDDSANSARQVIQMLSAGRGRFALLNEVSARASLRDAQLEGQFKVLPHPLFRDARYLFVSRRVAPAVVHKLKAALDSLAASGELKRIAAPYLNAL